MTSPSSSSLSFSLPFSALPWPAACPLAMVFLRPWPAVDLAVPLGPATDEAMSLKLARLVGCGASLLMLSCCAEAE